MPSVSEDLVRAREGHAKPVEDRGEHVQANGGEGSAIYRLN